MGVAGSDAALQAADVALMGDRLDRLPEAIDISRRALRVMRVNVIASLLVKGVFVLLAPFGLVTLVVAVAADMGMSLLVTLNALRLLRAERRDEPAPPVAAAPVADAACSDGCCTPAAPAPTLLELPLVGSRADD
jgi:Cd2+/Zn2+-exporting ATPase